MSKRMTQLIERLATAGQRRGGTQWAQSGEFDAALEVLSDEHAADGEDAVGIDDRLAGIAEVFGLDETDAELLWSAVAPDVDVNVGIAYGLLRGVTGIARVSVGLALELAGVPTTAPDGHVRLAPDAALRRHRLLEVIGSDPWLARGLRAPDPIAAALVGAEDTDPLVRAMRVPVVALELPRGAEIARAVTAGVALVWVHATPGSAGASLAAGAVAGLGLGWLAVDLRRLPDGQNLTEAVAVSALAAGLTGRALIVAGAETLGEAADRDSFQLLSHAAVPVIAVGSGPWNPSWLTNFPLIVEAEPLPAPARARLWDEHLDGVLDTGGELRQTLAGLRFTPEDVAETARYTQILATARDVPASAAIVREAARRVGGSHGPNANRVEASPAGGGPGFADLLLPDHSIASLRRLVDWGRHRDEISVHGALPGRGRGIAALFTGSPGTGKTLAAHVVAEELSVELFQIELSAVVDKYIGETEKNLEKVFQAAEALDVVLFFDEADALFGSRSAVNDARDRYANQEIAYLLQRMERFEGVTILATNLRGNLDRAFSRRMSFIVDFPDPEPETRRRLWDYHLSQLPRIDDADAVDTGHLAEELELTGGDIRNIVRASAYDGLRLDEPVGMRHIMQATMDEYRKLGKVAPEHGFGRRVR